MGKASTEPPSVTVEAVRELEARLRVDRSAVNSIVALIDACACAPSDTARLAAMQACRSLFAAWVSAGEFQLAPAAEEEGAPPAEAAGGGGAAFHAYQGWLRDKYRRFVRALRQTLQASETAAALKLPALDSLMLLAALEIRHGRGGGGAHVGALEASAGAFRELSRALGRAERPQPPEVMERLASEYCVHLDVSFFLTKHVEKMAVERKRAAATGAEAAELPVPARLLELLTLLTPPADDASVDDASFLVPLSEMRTAAQGGDKAVKAGGMARRWPPLTRRLLLRRTHRRIYCTAWRALLALPLGKQTFRKVIVLLPEAVLPHVSLPLRYCDFFSDGYSRGGLEALLCLRGLFVLMQRHNLEYPDFYARLYGLVTADAISGAFRERFVGEIQIFLSSSGLPSYLTAAFAKRLCRLALSAPPCGAALALALAFNLLLTHAAVRVLVHRPQGSKGPNTDPFLADESDPAACHALESCLWEVDTLRSHYCPTVSNMAALFAKPPVATTTPVEVAPLAEVDADAMMELEVARKLRQVPSAIERPQRLLAPRGWTGDAEEVVAGG